MAIAMMGREEQPRGQRAWVPVVVLLLVPLVLLTGAGGWWFGRSAMAQAELDERLADLRARGMPVDEETLAEYHRQGTDDTHTSAWLEILERLDAPGFYEVSRDLPVVGVGPEIPPLSEPWPEQQAVEEFLEPWRPTLDRVREVAGSDEPVWFPREDLDSSRAIDAMRTAARILVLEFEVAQRTGDQERALRAIHSLLGTSLALRGEVGWFGQLLSIASHNFAYRATQPAVEGGQLNAQECAALVARLRLFENFVAPYGRAVAGERAMALSAFTDPANAADGPLILRTRSMATLLFLDICDPLENLPGHDLDAFSAAVSKVAKRMTAATESDGMLQRFDKREAMTRFSTCFPLANALTREVMANRLALLGLAIRQFHCEHGRWPEDLEALQAVGVDASQLMPLGGRPFGYRVEAGEAVLWGFNPHGDLDAVPPEPPPIVKPGDKIWVWRLR